MVGRHGVYSVVPNRGTALIVKRAIRHSGYKTEVQRVRGGYRIVVGGRIKGRTARRDKRRHGTVGMFGN